MTDVVDDTVMRQLASYHWETLREKYVFFSMKCRFYLKCEYFIQMG